MSESPAVRELLTKEEIIAMIKKANEGRKVEKVMMPWLAFPDNRKAQMNDH